MEKNEVTLARGCKLIADANILDCVNSEYDLVVLPGVGIVYTLLLKIVY